MTDRVLELWFLGCLVAILGSRALFVRGRPRGPAARSRVTGLDRALKAVNLLGVQLLPVVYVLTPWVDRWDFALPAWAGALGAALALLCLLLLWRCHAALGRSWSNRVELYAGHALVTHGVYRLVRHPIYGERILWGVAQALLLQSWLVGFTGLGHAIAFYLARVRREEAMLLAEFGDSYRAYMQRTGRLLPRLRRSAAPFPPDQPPDRNPVA